MADLTAERVAELRALLEKATPHNGYWTANHHLPGGRYESSWVQDGDATPLLKMWHPDNIDGARAIAELLNAAPALLDARESLQEESRNVDRLHEQVQAIGKECDAARAEAERLRKALEEIASHDSSSTIDAVAMKRFARAALEESK